MYKTLVARKPQSCHYCHKEIPKGCPMKFDIYVEVVVCEDCAEKMEAEMAAMNEKR